MFGKLKTDETAMNENTDRLGGGFQPLESGIYRATVVHAYSRQAQSGAYGLIVKLKVQESEDKERTHTETFWVSNKDGETFYVDDKGNRRNLMGFNQANQLVALLTGKSLTEIEPEEMTVNIYNVEAKKELPTTVTGITELTDKEVAVAILKRRINKTEKDVTGKYTNTPEESVTNAIDKFFEITEKGLLTFDEKRAGIKPEFADKWMSKWAGKLDDRYEEVKGQTKGTGTTKKLSIG